MFYNVTQVNNVIFNDLKETECIRCEQIFICNRKNFCQWQKQND